jgi:hypothetical protein
MNFSLEETSMNFSLEETSPSSALADARTHRAMIPWHICSFHDCRLRLQAATLKLVGLAPPPGICRILVCAAELGRRSCGTQEPPPASSRFRLSPRSERSR